MSLVVPCPACPAKLGAPESAAGKKIRCPKCGALADVPALVAAEEVPVVEAKVVPARSRPVVADEDDEEQEADEARPRRKPRDRGAEREDGEPRRRKKRKAAKGGSGSGPLLIVVAGLLLFCGVATGLFLLVRKDGPTAAGTGTDSPASSPAPNLFGPASPSERENPLPPAETQSAVPAGWQLHSEPDAGFRAYFPRPPITKRTSGTSTGPSGITTSRKGWELYSGGYIGQEEGMTINFHVQQFSHGAPAKVSSQLDHIAPRRGPGQARPVRWLGHQGSEVELPTSVVRVVVVGNTLFAAQVVGRGGMRPQPGEAAAFFTNVELTK